MLDRDNQLIFQALTDRHYWIQIIEGEFLVQNHRLQVGDAAQIDEQTVITIDCMESGEFLFFDLA